MNRTRNGIKSFVQGAATAATAMGLLPAASVAQQKHDNTLMEFVLEQGGPVFIGTERDYREAKRNAAYWKAGTHAKANKPGFYGNYYKHTGTVLDHLGNTEEILDKLVKDKDLLSKLDGLPLTEKHNILLYMLTAFHENREEGFLGMVAVTRVLENRVDNKYRKGETVEEQLAQLAQFTFVGKTPLEQLTNPAESKSWDMALRVAYFTEKGADMAQSRSILTNEQLSEAAILLDKMGDCTDYLTAEAAQNNGRLNEPQFRGYGLLQTREGSKHIYLVPPERER